MNLLFWSMTLSAVGAVLIAYGVINAHHVLEEEHRVDRKVVRSFRLERLITILGVVCIIAGYLMEIEFLGGFNYFLTCDSATECAGAWKTDIETDVLRDIRE